ncbi:MAG TPA: hypothetical protein VHG28_10200 [Longimicrobiaceae bacterium]|nr:hypothetical protein [Longimicrobiaceae bacterium]
MRFPDFTGEHKVAEYRALRFGMLHPLVHPAIARRRPPVLGLWLTFSFTQAGL